MKKYTDQKKGSRLSGVMSVTRSGKGFLLQDNADDIEVPAEWLGGALSGDCVEITKEKKYGKTMGRVVNVLERKTEQFVGELIKKRDGIYLKPDDTRVYIDFRIEGAPGGAVGDKVVAKVVSWERMKETVAVETVLGVAGEHETEMKAIIVARGFDSDFPQAVIDEAQALYERRWTDADLERREDFRETLTLTIDPKDAKDFDDAISLKEIGEGVYEVGVHIADVSFFVRPGTALDDEAYTRATSVYLVDRTIPMLPPQLSEDLCSLRPREDRLTFSAVFTVNEKMEVTDRRFTRGVINSDKRLTYEDADRALKNHEERFSKELSLLWKLASTLRAERKENGAIMFDVDEIRPVLDAHKQVVRFEKIMHTESHQLIEELMLLANREVATYGSQKLGKKSQLFVYRVHDKPKEERLEELVSFLRAIGHSLSLNKQGVSVKDLNDLFDTIQDTPEENLIRTATIRTMAKAIYTTKNIGHFGLSFPYYTHFTSPIRRYPDLIVHRTLCQLLVGEKILITQEEQEQRSLHASMREALAVEAERASVKFKQVEYFARHIGEKREGVVSGMTDWGIYVADNESGADGMIRLASITDDSYEHDRKKFAAVGARTGNTIRLGDPISFTVEKVNLDERTIDLRWVHA